MAPNTTGLLELDVANCLELTQRALEVTKKVLTKGGNFVCKIFEGPGTDNFVKEAKKYFKMVKRYRPRAVRRGSKEFYLIAKGFSPQRKS
jgi:23S rRNA (uridine2552-2'-O)-methyltransferase